MDNIEKAAIQVRDLSIIYREIRHLSLQNLRRKDLDKKGGYQALSDVTFDVANGEIIGLIGRNGSGKSTLLRAIAGIFSPDKGTIDLFGRTATILSIGLGFQRKLSGRENIYLSGMLLGFTRAQIDEKVDEIIAFSELEEYIEKPVRTYSNGMHSKLSFSIVAILGADIILIDEVLSVGDAYFQKKSMQKMRELISDANRTVVIVSHNMATIRILCSRAIWLADGRIKMIGETQDVIKEYEKLV